MNWKFKIWRWIQKHILRRKFHPYRMYYFAAEGDFNAPNAEVYVVDNLTYPYGIFLLGSFDI